MVLSKYVRKANTVLDQPADSLSLLRSNIEKLFNHVIHHILRLVKQQVSLASDRRGKPINICPSSEPYIKYAANRIGYIRPEFRYATSSNPLFLSCAPHEFLTTHILLTRRPSCISLRYRNLRIRGGAIPATIVCRRHYDISYSLLFNPLRGDEKHAHYIWGEKYCLTASPPRHLGRSQLSLPLPLPLPLPLQILQHETETDAAKA